MPRLSKIGAAALAAFGWTGLQSVTASYLVVAGGGAGAYNRGAGGGGAGGFQTGTTSLNPTLSYTVTVGAGGVGSGSGAVSSGSNSTFSALPTSSIGGGAGGSNFQSSSPYNGTSGGSGGGAGGAVSTGGTGGAATSGQGNAGGNVSGGATNTNNEGGAGGGGAGSAGTNATVAGTGTAGGSGLASSITGSSVTYAGGGGGAGNGSGSVGGSGGSGGGGSGRATTQGNGDATSGTANLGGGGGGHPGQSITGSSGNGGSGIVIISYVGTQQFGGGVVTSSGGNTIHTFTTSGTLSPLSSLTASYLIVAGGGGGSFGGAGAGGLLSGSSLTIDTNSIYAVTVGAGGAGQDSLNTTGTNGSNSAFSMVSTAAVGGGGGGKASGTLTGNSGGSGGGGGNNGAGGSGTSGQGNAGGNGYTDGATYGLGGGGGGASAAGQSVNSGSSTGGNGGAGSASSISGTSTTYAGGGGGGGHTVGSRAGGTGGSGGGGNGSTTGNASSGTNGLGGGGGGAGSATGTGGNGGSGVVIISYPGSTQQMAGGTVTVAGGNVIHTFTSSGYLTPIVLVNNSLRFRESASSYLNRTPTTAGNNQKFTMSVWYKPGNIGTSFTNANFISAGGDGSNIIIAGSGAFGSTVDNRFLVRENNATAQFYWSMVFRDPAAWYHIVLAVDTTQTNSNNRAKLYVNGVDQGAFSGTGYSLSATTSFNTVTAHYIGAFNSAYYYTSCYFAEYNWIDGQQLTANSFGTSNGLGVWQPIRYGGSYGTNGFYLPFPNSGAVTANYLVVAGGGGGGIGGAGGGGGAGGLRSTVTATGGGGSLESALTLNAGNSYTVTVGAGGAGGISEALGTSGSNSVFSTITSTGGGGGSYASSSGGTPLGSGALSGGSGGGGSAWRNSIGTTSTQSNAAGTANQGFAGGSAPTQSTNSIGTGGGGGGAGAVGADAVQNTSSGNGGAGVAVAISGSSVTYGGGGGGGGANATAGTGGSGGGGNGANGSAGSSGTANLGGGGGGGSSGSGGSGGSGVVIVSYAGTPKFTGGVVSQVGGNTIHTFTTSGTLNGIGSDYSPNGNNWTPNNFSFSSGSTYDSMTDVPTLTSATTANYCVWSPINRRSTVQIKNTLDGNLNVSGDSNQTGIIFATIYPTTGKWYYEFSPANTYANSYIGCGNTSENINQYPGNSTNSVGLEIGTGKIYSSSLLATYTGISAGEIGMIAWDCATGKVWMGRQGTWFNSGDPAAGTGQVATLTAGEIGPIVTPYLSSGVISTTFGQRPFAYTPPTGFVALNTFNLPTPTIGATASTTANKYFDATLYTGTGSALSVTNSGSMQPDFIWVKSRTYGSSHGLVDSVRGLASGLNSNATSSQTTLTDSITSINSNGFSLGADSTTWFNYGGSYVAWQWRASNATAVTNTAGSIISTVSANTTAGFSIVTYTGNGVSGDTVGHGLGVTPSMVILKQRDGASNWQVKHVSLNANQNLILNSTAAVDTAPGSGYISAISSTTLTLLNGGSAITNVNGNGSTYVAYCFAPVAGYSAFGSYTGNGSADGPFIFTGFRPRYYILKNITNAQSWSVQDTSRSPYNVGSAVLLPNSSSAELTGTDFVDILSNGFKIRHSSSGNNNNSGDTYIYMAFAESPLKFANAR